MKIEDIKLNLSSSDLFMNSFTRSILVILFTLLLNTCFAQGSFNQDLPLRNSIAVNFQKSIAYLPTKGKMEGVVFGGELIYKVSTVDNPTDWVRKLNVKSINFIFNYKDLNNLEVAKVEHTFGRSYSVLAGLNVSLYRLNKVDFNLLPAIGLGYTTKTNLNSQNPLIGSHLNFYLKLGLEVETDISEMMTAFASVDLSHFSNGALKLPNLGTNISNVGIGISRKLNQSRSTKRDTLGYEAPLFKKHHLELGINFGKRGVDGGGNKGLYKNGVYLGYQYSINSVVDLGLGTDAVYYHTVYDIINHKTTNQSFATSYDHWRVGIAFGPAVNLGRIDLSTKFGYYLHYNNPQKQKSYWTFAVKYGFTSWLAAETKLYIHNAEADYLGLGLSFFPFR